MKKSLIHILVAVVTGSVGLSFAASEKDAGWAAEATNVVVSLNSSKITGPAEVLRLPRVGDALNIDYFEQSKSGPSKQDIKDNKELWYVVNVPIRIHAVGRSATGEYTPARYVRELAIRATLLVRKPKSRLKETKDKAAREKDSYYILSKEFTIVDVPMKRATKNAAGKDVGEADVQLGLFVPHASVYAMLGTFNDAAAASGRGAFSSSDVAGYAIEATFKGESCREIESKAGKTLRSGETPNSMVFSSKLASEVGSRNWWSETKSYFDAPNAEIYCISETPYAAFYAPYYPRVRPMFGKPETASGSSSSGSSTDTDSSSTSSSDSSSSATTSSGSTTL